MLCSKIAIDITSQTESGDYRSKIASNSSTPYFIATARRLDMRFFLILLPEVLNSWNIFPRNYARFCHHSGFYKLFLLGLQ